jgi:hypothetical protein
MDVDYGMELNTIQREIGKNLENSSFVAVISSSPANGPCNTFCWELLARELAKTWAFLYAVDSASLFFFFSRQTVNAQPTAWLSLSPCEKDKLSLLFIGEEIYRIFHCLKTMAHPSPCCTITTNICKSLLIVTIG